MTISPTEMSLPDAGDDVQRRFRYQVNYTALKCLQLVAENSEVCAVYCEHIEDVMIEFKSGKLVGIQIKTRELTQGQFRASDVSVTGALVRFCVRDAKFSGAFDGFVLATNFAFVTGESSENLQVAIDACRSGQASVAGRSGSKIRKYIQGIADAAEVSYGVAVSTLAKVTIEARLTGIDQPDLELVHALGELEGLATRPLHELKAIAQSIRNRIWDASSLATDGSVMNRYQHTSSLPDLVEELRAKKKRVVADEIAAMCRVTGDYQELLSVAGYVDREAIPAGLGVMEYKMEVGGLSYSDVEQMKDDVATLERTFIRWQQQYGIKEANRRLGHLQYLAQRDARAAEATVAQPTGIYGPQMLSNLRTRSAVTTAEERGQMFGCRSEHLVGTAGLLSEECKVWWGRDRNIPSRRAS